MISNEEILEELRLDLTKYQNIKNEAVIIRDRIFDGFERYIINHMITNNELSVIKNRLQNEINIIKKADKAILMLENDISELMLEIWENGRRSPGFNKTKTFF